MVRAVVDGGLSQAAGVTALMQLGLLKKAA